MKKRLNIDDIANELKGGSAFFPDYQKSESPPLTRPVREEQPAKVFDPVPPVRDVLPVRPVLPVPPAKRVMKQRWPSDIYQDQYEALQEFSLEDRRLGLAGSMSAMVREALDMLIAKRRGK